jgi:hypothetical protein
MTDTVLHNLCKGFGALLSRSKVSIEIFKNEIRKEEMAVEMERRCHCIR